jgi:hypothetical protein
MLVYGLQEAATTCLTGESVSDSQTCALAIKFGSISIKVDVVNSYLTLSSIESKSKW